MDSEFSTVLRQTKEHITKKGAENHYKSIRNYYSFGNKSAYKTDGKKLVAQYASKG